MTKAEILRLAEFDGPKTRNFSWNKPGLDNREAWCFEKGAEYENCRLMPLIEALAESNEKLRFALAKIESNVADVVSTPVDAQFIKKIYNISDMARNAMAQHYEDMGKIK